MERMQSLYKIPLSICKDKEGTGRIFLIFYPIILIFYLFILNNTYCQFYDNNLCSNLNDIMIFYF